MSRTRPPGRTDAQSRVIAATPQAIYRAFTDAAAWPQWLPPGGVTGRVDLFEPRPGGRYRMVLTFHGADARPGKTSENTDIVEGRFAELVPDRRVVHLVTFRSDDPAFAGEMRMTWALMPADGGTEVSFIAENVPPGISKQDHDTGMRSTLENLARFVE